MVSQPTKNATDWTVSRPTGMGVDGKTNGFEWARKRIIGHGFSAAVRTGRHIPSSPFSFRDFRSRKHTMAE